MATYKIRLTEPTDFFGIVRLLKLANYQTLDIGGSKLSQNFISAEAENGDLAGIAGMETYDYNALCRSLAVDKNHINTGAEEALLKKIEDTATMKGMHKIYALCHPNMASAYENVGYERVANDKIPLNIKKTDEFVFFRDYDFACLLKRTDNFVEADEAFEVYTEADLKKRID